MHVRPIPQRTRGGVFAAIRVGRIHLGSPAHAADAGRASRADGRRRGKLARQEPRPRVHAQRAQRKQIRVPKMEDGGERAVGELQRHLQQAGPDISERSLKIRAPTELHFRTLHNYGSSNMQEEHKVALDSIEAPHQVQH